MILSVSRRTDIPAFYSDWFMERLRAGFVYVRSPFNIHQISEIPLSPENVDCIVFWTKNSKPVHKYLPEIDKMGYKYYFQFTITPYHKDIEENIMAKTDIIQVFKDLSNMIGKEKVILRYDPILLNDRYTLNFHYTAFDKLCNHLKDYTEKVVISFLDDYKKISKNIINSGIREITNEEMNKIAENFSITAKKYGLIIETCAEEIDLDKYNINHAKCIDGDLIERIINKSLKRNKNGFAKDGNRDFCGCMKCIDIGEYNTCFHRCIYCYANINKNSASENYKKHIKTSPLLIGEVDENIDKINLRDKDTKSLIDTKINQPDIEKFFI